MAIVVSHLAPDLEALLDQLHAEPPMADVVELRLDHIGWPGDVGFQKLRQAAGKPVIVTVRGPEGYGHFEGSAEERDDVLLRAAKAGANFIDVDWRDSLALGEVEGKCHRIVSRHELDGTPEDLESVLEEVRDVLYEGDLIKLVTHAETAEDGLRMLRFVRETGGGAIGFCSGEAGAFTRVLAPIFGSPFTYAAPARLPGRETAEAAPGQIAVNDLRGLHPPGGLTPETAIFAVLGNPISHSLSPRVHNMALKAAKLDAVYVAIELASFDGFTELFEDENFRGLSVTAPFKEAALAAAGEADDDTRGTGAANTLVRFATDHWRAANTDTPAIVDTLERAFRFHGQKPGRPVALGAAHCLVLGTGGAARAAVAGLRKAAGRVTVCGRNAQRAKELALQLGVQSAELSELGTVAYDALVHCTPCGSLSHPEELPLPLEHLRPETVVLDAVYRPMKTPLLAAAIQRGCTPVPGGEWFVRQAEAQFKLFTGQDAPSDLMRAAFETGIREAAGEGG